MNQQSNPVFTKKIFSRTAISSLFEFGPVIIFLISSQYVRIYESTMILMVATIISTIATYRIQKRIPYLALYMALITIIFGMLTIHFHEVKFIQMRDTLYDATCALTLLVGLRFNIKFLALAFNAVIPMSDRAWEKLTYLWIGYFIIVAVANEIARYMLTLQDWFVFKGIIVFVTVCFGFMSLFLSYEAQGKKDLTKG